MSAVCCLEKSMKISNKFERCSRNDIDKSLSFFIGKLADLIDSLVEVPFFLGEDSASHHEQQQEELRIEVAEHLLDYRIGDEQKGEQQQLLLPAGLFLLVALWLELQGFDDESDWVNEEDEDSEIGGDVLERIVKEGSDEQHSYRLSNQSHH